MKPFISKHYWRKHLHSAGVLTADTTSQPPCNAPATLSMLSSHPQDALSWFDRVVAVLSTPFKRLGISGWRETGCSGSGRGNPVRPAQHSTDGFWTIDISLSSLFVGGVPAPPNRFLRLEIEPDTPAHAVCAAAPPTEGQTIVFGGAIVIDTDGPFLELHPDKDFNVERPA
jgi:hypothetical protein